MALKIDISQVAEAMHSLAEAVREVRVRISIDDMLELSRRAAAGRTGSSVVPQLCQFMTLSILLRMCRHAGRPVV